MLTQAYVQNFFLNSQLAEDCADLKISEVSSDMIQVNVGSDRIVFVNSGDTTSILTTVQQAVDYDLSKVVLVPVRTFDSTDLEAICDYAFSLARLSFVVQCAQKEADERNLEIDQLLVGAPLFQDYKIICKPEIDIECFHNGEDFDYRDREVKYTITRRGYEMPRLDEYRRGDRFTTNPQYAILGGNKTSLPSLGFRQDYMVQEEA
jgi:hypothetical protein